MAGRPESRVSCHYVIGRDGRVTQMVAESMRAWHAGVSHWAGETDINSRSIGIEIDNPGHELGYLDFPEAPMRAVETLAADIVRRQRIDAEPRAGAFRCCAHPQDRSRRKVRLGEACAKRYRPLGRTRAAQVRRRRHRAGYGGRLITRCRICCRATDTASTTRATSIPSTERPSAPFSAISARRVSMAASISRPLPRSSGCWRRATRVRTIA